MTPKSKRKIVIIALIVMAAGMVLELKGVLDSILPESLHVAAAWITLIGPFAAIVCGSLYRYRQVAKGEAAPRRKPRRKTPKQPMSYTVKDQEKEQ